MPRRIAGSRHSFDAPGWYTDDADPAVERYFNGGSWTEQTRPARGEPRHRGALIQGVDAVDGGEDADYELVALSTATGGQASTLYRLADVFGVLMAVLSGLGYLGCIAIAVATDDKAAGVSEALAIAAGITVQLIGVLFLVAWGKTYALDVQRKVRRSAL